MCDHSANFIYPVVHKDHFPPGQCDSADPSSGPDSPWQPPLSIPAEQQHLSPGARGFSRAGAAAGAGP